MMREDSADARRSVYAGSLRPQAMERAGKLSDGSIRVERKVEICKICKDKGRPGGGSLVGLFLYIIPPTRSGISYG